MPQKPEAEPLPLSRPLNNSRNVRHHKRPPVPVRHHAQIRPQRRERIVRNLWLGRTDDAQERRLAGIRKSHESHVGEQLEFENLPFFPSVLAGLGVTGGLVGRGFEMVVAEPPASARGDNDLLAVLGDFDLHLPRLGIANHRPQRHLDQFVSAIGAVLVLAGSALAGSRNHMFPVLQMQQRPKLRIPPHNHVSAPATIAAIRPAFGVVFAPVKVSRSWTALPRAAANLDVVDEILTGQPSLRFVELTHRIAQPTGNFVDAAHAVDADIFSGRAVKVRHRRRLRIVDVDALLNHGRIGVVRTS